MAIISFGCEHTASLFETGSSRQFRAFERIAIRKLQLLDKALTLDFLKSPPGNRLEALKGGRRGQYSIRINDQFRVCFIWTDEGPKEVEIVDYH